jgi:hypothetical protein
MVAYCYAGLACIAALRGDAELAGERWGCAERIQDEVGERFHVWDRKRYEQILESITHDPAFRGGYEAARAAPEEATARFV